MSERCVSKAVLAVCVFLLAGAPPTFAQRIICVDADATGTSDGSSWANAYNHLQDALADANSGAKPAEIWVAQGIYRPDRRAAQADGTGDRQATFQLISAVALKGGYAGAGEPDPNGRDIGLYETILSGDLAGNDVEVADPCDLPDEPTRSENSYHVVTGSATDETAALSGFTITGGNADSSLVEHERGGGMYNRQGSPFVADCTFVGNSAFSGGGLQNHDGHMTLEGCTFAMNAASIAGGISNLSSDLTARRCLFVRNRATVYYGGACCQSAWPEGTATFMECSFVSNSAKAWGGGVFCFGDMFVARFTNCLFAANTADEGGAIYVQVWTGVRAANCTFTSNRAARGSGLYVDEASVHLQNSILWNDSLYLRGASVTHSLVQGGWPGEGNIDQDPCFAEPGYWDPNDTPEDANDDFWVDGDYHLKSQGGRWDTNRRTWVQDEVTSPCIDAGMLQSPIGREPFPNAGIVNMGAYGSTAEASKSYFGDALCETIVAGDINGDCNVDFADFALMAGHWLGNASDTTCRKAADPDPPDGATNVSIYTKLSWTSAPSAMYHIVYVVYSDCSDVLPPSYTATSSVADLGFLWKPDCTYQWDVDEVCENATIRGDRWEFTTGTPPPEPVDNPSPPDGAEEISVDAELSWSPGAYAAYHDLYLGFEQGAVADANESSPEYRGSRASATFDPAGLEVDTLYYWRVDAVNREGRAKGPVWRFRTSDTPPKIRMCFAPATGVWVDGDLVEIVQVGAGQKAGRLDCLARTGELKEIEEVQEHEGTYDCYDVVLATGEVITVADEHYFLVDAGRERWVSLHDLKPGSVLKSLTGPLRVTAVLKRPTPVTGKVYNLKIKDSDRYFVGRSAIIVRDF